MSIKKYNIVSLHATNHGPELRVPLRAVEELPKVRRGDLHAVPEEVVPDIPDHEEVVGLHPNGLWGRVLECKYMYSLLQQN